MNNERTPEQVKDFQSRAELFAKDIQELSKKYEVGIAAEPQYAGVKEGLFMTTAVVTFIDKKEYVKVEKVDLDKKIIQ